MIFLRRAENRQTVWLAAARCRGSPGKVPSIWLKHSCQNRVRAMVNSKGCVFRSHGLHLRFKIREVAPFERLEGRLLFIKIEFDLSRRAVAMLFNENLGYVRTVGIFLIFIFAVNEHHNGGICPNFSTAAKVGGAGTPPALPPPPRDLKY